MGRENAIQKEKLKVMQSATGEEIYAICDEEGSMRNATQNATRKEIYAICDEEESMRNAMQKKKVL